MSQLQIGQIQPTGVTGTRDAFHVPCVLVTCSEVIHGGNRIKFVDNSFSHVAPCDTIRYHAIADPFLGRIEAGWKFWVLLRPGTISERLTHHFDINITDVANVLADEPEDDPDDPCRGCW